MRDLVTGEVFPIGTPGQGRMEPIPEALDSHAAAILRKIPDGSDVMIDEVGYLESSCARYAKELERLFDRCTVIAALRKDHTPLLDRLRSRPDVFVWDLDLHQHPCQVGCVVMASGWSRRFSGENKLLLPVDGKPMIRHTLEKLAALPLERVTVVSRYEPVRAIAAEYGFQALDNPLMLQSDTIRLGLAEMAEMDGLEFIREIRERQLAPGVIIVSCHEDFSYAQRAISIGTDSYILKHSVTEKSLIQEVKNVYEKTVGKETEKKQAGTEEKKEKQIR